MNVGILGAGHIASVLARTIKGMESVKLYAVASRSKEKAEEFAREFGAEKFYGSYEELVKDSAVDLVYIATPHNFHYEQMKLCINNNKAVLCEKAFTINENQAKDVFSLAEKKKVFYLS